MYRLTKRKGRKIQISFDNGKTWQSTGYDNMDEAIAYAKRFGIPTFRDYATDFYEKKGKGSYLFRKTMRGKELTECTIYKKKLIVSAHLLKYFGDMTLDSIHISDIEDWLYKFIQKGYNGNTVNQILYVLKEILSFAVMDGLIETNEAEKIETMNGKIRKRIPLTREEFKTLFPDDDNELLKIWGNTYAKYFLIFLDTGFRPCEILALRYESIREDNTVYTEHMYDTYTKEIHHRIKTSHSGKNYKIGVLSDRTIKLIGKGEGFIFDTHKYTVKSAWAKFKTVSINLINRKDVTQYQLRHVFMTNRKQILPKELVMELMGHTTWEACYDDSTPDMIMDNLRKALNRYQA